MEADRYGLALPSPQNRPWFPPLQRVGAAVLLVHHLPAARTVSGGSAEGKPSLVSGYQLLERIYIRHPFNSLLSAGVPSLGTQTFWLGESLGYVGGCPRQEAGQHPGLCSPHTRSDSRPRCDSQRYPDTASVPGVGGRITPIRRPQAKSVYSGHRAIVPWGPALFPVLCTQWGSSRTLPVAGWRPRRDCLSK